MKTANGKIIVLASVLLASTPGVAPAQDPVQVAPETYKVVLDTPRVRVLEIKLPPGGKSPMHSHPAFIIYSFNANKTKFTLPDGTTREVSMKPGEIAWSEATSHAAENVGGTAAHILNIELKEPPAKTKISLQSRMDPVRVNPGKYKAVFENERVRVLEYRDKPGDKALMHSHPDHLVYALSDLQRRFTFPDGKTADLRQEGGSAVWVNAETHAGENTGQTDTHVLIVELKDQPAAHTSSASSASAGAMSVRFQDAKWEKMLPELEKDSPEISILRVDPKTQAAQLLIRTPAAMHVPKHWHAANETHTMIIGTATFECDGERVTLGPGSFNYIPGKMVHQAWTSAGSVVFITVDHAWDINWVEGPPKASDVGVAPPDPAK
ncbi:MAG: cupin domain-containing protein [Verrucomicrobia bacterium]|nr:cupin domain-containing protein [Verrucomicrobiota bacterium]